MKPNKRYIIIDTDPGVDDAQAIMMALSQEDNIEIVAFTTVTGNCSVDQAIKNLKRVLTVCQRPCIPIHKGSRLPLLIDEPESKFHGEDGFGDFYPNDIDSNPTSDIPAAQALIQYGKQFEGKLELVCLAPLTNVALAYHLDPMFSSYFKHIYIMGGNYLGRGNVTPTAEFNFYADVEAAHIVIRALNVPKTLVCWELSEQHQISMDWYHDVWGSLSSQCNEFRKNININILSAQYNDSSGYYLCDELLMGIVLWSPDLIAKSVDIPARVIVSGECRGMLACDMRYFTNGKPDPGYETVRVITEINMELFKNRLIECMKQLP